MATRHRGERSRRSRGEWAWRAGLAAAALAGGGFATTFSLARMMSTADPAAAHRLAPYDGRIAARLASSLAGPDADASGRAKAGRIAQLALRRDPTAVAAVSTLGFNAQIRGDTGAARRLFAHARLLSRRDLTTQLWSIEDAVARGDVAGALRHYDVALRTRPALADVLYPVLAAAIADPAIRSALTRTLAGKPGWTETFVSYVASQGPDPRSTARLFLDLERAGVSTPAEAQAGIVDALVAGGLSDDAWTYYASHRPGADRRRSRDPRFTARLDKPSLLDWVPISEGGVVTSIPGGVFEFSAPAGIGGSLLQQAQLLAPGVYRLSGRSRGIGQAEQARPYWTLQCRGDGRELGRVVVPGGAAGGFAGTFTVPAGCPVQMLTLLARPADGVDGLSGQIDRVELAPVR